MKPEKFHQVKKIKETSFNSNWFKKYIAEKSLDILFLISSEEFNDKEFLHEKHEMITNVLRNK